MSTFCSDLWVLILNTSIPRHRSVQNAEALNQIMYKAAREELAKISNEREVI
jgi:hypothetical protein